MARKRRVQVVTVAGDLTLATAERYREQLISEMAQVPRVLLSLSQATELDAAGIQLMIAAKRTAQTADCAFQITGSIPEAIAKRLVQSGLSETHFHEGTELDSALDLLVQGTSE